MDLKTYAVKQALDGNPDLLKAVSQNKPIDLDVANKSFAPLIADQDAGDTQNLIDNYPDYLVRHTKMQINSGKQDDDLEISGEVDDNLLEVIELLHHVQPGDVVKQAASRLMAKFAPDKAIDVADITFAKSSNKAPESKQEDVKANEAKEIDEAPAEMPEVEASVDAPEENPVEMPEVETPVDAPEAEDMTEMPEAGLPDYAPDDEVPAFDENDFDSLVNQAPAEEADKDVDEEPAEDADEDADEDAEIDHDLGDIEAGMNSKIIPLKPTLEKPDQAEVESAQKLKLAYAFKDAMHFLKDKIQEKQLDQKLNGLHMNALDV